MAQIELRNVQKFFGAVQVIKDMNLTIEDGEFVVMRVTAPQHRIPCSFSWARVSVTSYCSGSPEISTLS